MTLIIDCHGHYTTAPPAHDAWREAQVAAFMSTRLNARKPVVAAAWGALVFFSLLPLSPAAAKTEPMVGSNYGPPPDWARYRELGEAALKNILVDPDSARIQWPSGYVQRGYTPWFQHRIYGYVTCGLVNGRNRMGGNTGKVFFGIVIDHDQALYVGVGDIDGQDFLSKACAKGNFPPAIAMTTGSQAGDDLGFLLTDTPQGAFVVTVTPGGNADQAGLKANNTITRFNGIALSGMSEGKINDLVAGTAGTVTLTLNTGAVIAVQRAPAASPATSPRPMTPPRLLPAAEHRP